MKMGVVNFVPHSSAYR